VSWRRDGTTVERVSPFGSVPKVVTAEKPSAAPGRLGRYEVCAKIADGGMAAVYVARRDDGEVVAVKMIREEFAKNADFLTMLLDEAKIVSHLRHPNIVRYQELGRDEQGHAFLVMELLYGQSLWAAWERCRLRGVRLRYDVIAWIGARVADGLHYAHELIGDDGRSADIVHRDVNATNIFVTYGGDIKIIDFGLAKATNRASKTAAGVIKGKVAYMSPEQAVGAPVDRRTDVFALGTTLWELSCDRRLFKHTDEVETLRRVHAADVPEPTKIVAGYPPELARIVRRALARDKERRYPTAEEMARALDTFAGGTANAGVVADVMRELFADDYARQAAWVAEASAPDGPARGKGEGRDGLVADRSREMNPKDHPLKPRSRFWAEDADAPAAPLFARAQPGARGGGQGHDNAGDADPSLPERLTWQALLPPLAAIAIVLGVVLALAMALR
jgi:serine/threonine-protein kinase